MIFAPHSFNGSLDNGEARSYSTLHGFRQGDGLTMSHDQDNSSWNSDMGPGNDSDNGVAQETRIEDDLEHPRRFKVLLHNDDYTSMDFVVRILKTIFHKNENEAVQIMLAVHEKGKGVCGVFTVEVAETKVAMVSREAKKAGYPLRSSMEEV